MRLPHSLLDRFGNFVGKMADREVKLLNEEVEDAKLRGFGPDHPRLMAVQKALDEVEALIKKHPLHLYTS